MILLSRKLYELTESPWEIDKVALELSPGKAENEVACLPDVDVVPRDVVQEQERLPRGQRVQVRLRKKAGYS